MNHLCHWPGCRVEVPPRLWGCRDHWFTLPHELRGLISKSYHPKQEIAKTPSPAYRAAAAAAEAWACVYERNRGQATGQPCRPATCVELEPGGLGGLEPPAELRRDGEAPRAGEEP